ncbi:MAG: hypothetical protein IJV15_05850 [Lachnospiraceae bacterium]|nr:hypothetical protein [Lachnospiraceae bacterium]
MTKEDYIALIEVADAIELLDRGFENWLGVGHVGGNLDGLDRLYGVLLRNANSCYSNDGEGGEQLFYDLLADMAKTPEERAEILLNGTIRYCGSNLQ